MNTITQKIDVLIIGAGPIGLFLGLRLHQLGLSFKILEKNNVRDPHSRALGVHPPSMELLQTLQVSDVILSKAKKIDSGLLYMERKKIASIDLSSCKKPFNYVIAIPQLQTEIILEEILLSRYPGCIETGSLIDFCETDESITAQYSTGDKDKHEIQTSYLVGCDGKNSFVRNKADIAFVGDLYSEQYIMGDFQDFSPLNDNVALFTGKKGVIESFPLPNQCRRWVVNVGQEIDAPSGEKIAQFIFERIGLSIEGKDCFWATTFKTQGLIAEKIASERVLLCGDAACVVSPIGGQGMNLGWFNAWALAEALVKANKQPEERRMFFDHYNKIAIKNAKNATKRARLYRYLGRQSNFLLFKKMIAYALTHWPCKRIFYNIFTMRYF